MATPTKVRVDKWLWSVRIFKSRSLATDVCKSRKVKVNDKVVKASFNLSGGETISVVKNGYNLTLKVVQLINKRVSATLAEPCYKNLTPKEEMDKYKSWYIGKGKPELRERGEGRPTKKDRRNIDEFKGFN